jgi:hypothetical protein
MIRRFAAAALALALAIPVAANVAQYPTMTFKSSNVMFDSL